MEYKFDAFISYRHAEVDSAVPSYGYQYKTNSFIDIDEYHEKRTFGYRKRYDTDSLISEAKRQLGDFKLSDTQRVEYGLS